MHDAPTHASGSGCRRCHGDLIAIRRSSIRYQRAGQQRRLPGPKEQAEVDHPFGGQIRVLGGYRKPGHQPYDTARIPGMRWSSWVATIATAKAYEWIDDGYPSVGGGTYYAIPVHIRLWRPRDSVFTRMTITSHTKNPSHPNPDWRNPPAQQTFKASDCCVGRVESVIPLPVLAVASSNSSRPDNR